MTVPQWADEPCVVRKRLQGQVAYACAVVERSLAALSQTLPARAVKCFQRLDPVIERHNNRLEELDLLGWPGCGAHGACVALGR